MVLLMEDNSIKRLLIVGNPEEYHVGAHFLSAAKQLGVEARLLDVREAHSRNVWVNRFFHRAWGKRPAHLGRFSQRLAAICRERQPQLLLVTGISAPHAGALKEIGGMGIQRANYLTDDPWNPANGARFFWPALREYDAVWSPRRANLDDLRHHGCKQVAYLPFGYNPELHFPESPKTAEERERFECDVAIIGGADDDRFPIALALARAGFKLKLYGGYWDRNAELRRFWKGFVHGRELRMAVGGARVNICMGRKANRDGHAMRSLEFPAMGACLMVEDTLEHRELFGEDGVCVEYYAGLDELVAKAKALCAEPERAQALGQKAFRHTCRDSKNTYADRLEKILDGQGKNQHD
jgi:spore maturation protein CgeB